MEKTLFDKLKQSLKEAKAIRAEEINASRRFTIISGGASKKPQRLTANRGLLGEVTFSDTARLHAKIRGV